MKRILLTLLLVVTTIVSVMSQTENSIVHTMKLDNNNIVYLYMDPYEYQKLSDIGKRELVIAEADKYSVTTIYIVCAHSSELWQKSNGIVKMIDSWNLDKVKPFSNNSKKQTNGRSLQRPWFFNISGALGANISDSQSIMINAYGYGRVGCYLLKSRWDLALNGMIGYNKKAEKEAKGNFSGSIGVDTRVYILKGKVINPFAGVGIAYATSSGESSVTIPLSAGLSIPIKGNGCIDFCYKYDKVTKSAIIVGYTYMHK